MRIRVFIMTPNMQLVFAWARFKPARVCSWHLRANSRCWRLRFTVQHVYGHTGNLGNECADHAAALSALGLVSHHNLSARWARHTFDTAACFASCNNIGDVLEKLGNIRTEVTSIPQNGT